MHADDLARMLGWEFSLMVATVRLINSGLLGELPSLKIQFAHFAGGIGRSTRKYARSVRLSDGDLASRAKRATTKSLVSRRFVALSTAKLKDWLAIDLSGLSICW
jgi:hypothetical protein